VEEPTPNDEEIKTQLARVLASRRFKRATNGALFLQHVVEKALAKEPINEESIGLALFPGWLRDVSNDVRVTANHLRGYLDKYYANEGANDFVKIDLPAGPKYLPSFSYNPRAFAIARYRRGQHLLQTFRFPATLAARQEFFKAVNKHRDFALGHASLADAQLRIAFIYRLLVLGEFYDSHDGEFKFGFEEAQSAVRLDPSCWYTQYVYGVACVFLWQWRQARAAFERALTLNERECKDRFLYPAFILTNGAEHGCVEAAIAAARQNPENFHAQLGAALVLYASEDALRAQHFLKDLAPLSMSSWEMQVIQAMNSLLLGNFEDVSNALTFSSEELGGLQIKDVFPGLTAILRAAEGNAAEANRILVQVQNDPYPKPEQTAMAYMAVGRMQEAIEELRQACERRDPLMLWLPVWPIFKPLRENSAFKELIRQIKLAGSQPSGLLG
jgi:tetratricopeptide (TPR) repeat protein